jgi:4-hydroxybenzoate polyprenyltransferase
MLIASLLRFTNQLSLPFYVLVAGSGAHILWQVWSADVMCPHNLWSRFDSNKYIGGVIAVAIISGKMLVCG